MGFLKSFFRGLSAANGDPDAICDGIIPVATTARNAYEHYRKSLNHSDALDNVLHGMCQQLRVDRQKVDELAQQLKNDPRLFGPRDRPFGSEITIDGAAKDWLAAVWAVHQVLNRVPTEGPAKEYVWGWFRNYFSRSEIFRKSN